MEETIQPLSRVALELGPLTIHWYGVIIGLGAFLGYLLATRESVNRGLHKDTFADLLVWALPMAILGARMYYVIFQWDFYGAHPEKIFAIWEGGLAIHGGLIGGVVTAIVFAKKRNISIWKLLDIAVPSVLLGQAIGRWGNFMNQEAHGGPVTREFLENLMLPEFIVNQMYINGTYYHPTFLYESLWNIAGVLFLLWLRRVNLRQGELFLSYLIWYSTGRFFIEGMRTDSLMIADLLRIAQVMSLGLIIVALFVWIYRRQTGQADRHYLDRDVLEKKKAVKKSQTGKKKKKK